MLAYVFWHGPLPTISEHDYTDRLVTFHHSLRDHAFSGFHSSHVFQIERVPWGPIDQPFYEDWYLVENFAALGTLNTTAVTAANKAPHDQAAHYAACGTAGVYQLYAGEADPARAHVACWFGKPAGISYGAFSPLIRALVEKNGGTLWQRQMTLGPTPEFCWWEPVGVVPLDTIIGMRVPLIHVLLGQ